MMCSFDSFVVHVVCWHLFVMTGSRCSFEHFGGNQVKWHSSLHDVPQGLPTLYIAHEFFDALPVHQFQSTVKHGWCERLVDLDERGPGPSGLRMVLSPGATVAGGLVLRPRMMALLPSVRVPHLHMRTLCPHVSEKHVKCTFSHFPNGYSSGVGKNQFVLEPT